MPMIPTIIPTIIRAALSFNKKIELNALNNTDLVSKKEIMQYLINLSEKFEQKNDDFKRNVVETFVDKVIIYKDRVEVKLQFINF